MRVFIRRKDQVEWEEIHQTAEVSIALEKGGRVDFADPDLSELRMTMVGSPIVILKHFSS